MLQLQSSCWLQSVGLSLHWILLKTMECFLLPLKKAQQNSPNFLLCPEYGREWVFTSHWRSKRQSRVMYCTLSQWCRAAIRTFFVSLCMLLFLIISSLEKIILSTFNFLFSTLVLFFILMSHLPLKRIQMKEREMCKKGNCCVLIKRRWQLCAIFFLSRLFLFMIMPLLTTT